VAQFNLSPAAQIEYDQLVKIQYRSEGFLLRDAVRRKENVIGSSVQFRKMGQVISVPTGYAQAVTPQNPGIYVPSAQLQKYTTPVVVDDVEALTVNFDATMESVIAIGQAMGRRSDQITINAINADVGQTITLGTAFSYTGYTQIMEFFENNGVPLGDRWVAMTAAQFRSLLAADQFVSTFFTQNRVLDRGFVKEYLGINLVIIPQMTEGGLPSSGGVTTALAWHKMAVGFGVGANFRAEVNYVPVLTSWLANGVFSAGSVVIDDRGTLAVTSTGDL
jgi:hypothetical protein